MRLLQLFVMQQTDHEAHTTCKDDLKRLAQIISWQLATSMRPGTVAPDPRLGQWTGLRRTTSHVTNEHICKQEHDQYNRVRIHVINHLKTITGVNALSYSSRDISVSLTCFPCELVTCGISGLD